MIDKSWIQAHADDEIEGAKKYFKAAQQCDNDEHKKVLSMMGKQELEHAGMLYSMLY